MDSVKVLLEVVISMTILLGVCYGSLRLTRKLDLDAMGEPTTESRVREAALEKLTMKVIFVLGLIACGLGLLLAR